MKICIFEGVAWVNKYAKNYLEFLQETDYFEL